MTFITSSRKYKLYIEGKLQKRISFETRRRTFCTTNLFQKKLADANNINTINVTISMLSIAEYR